MTSIRASRGIEARQTSVFFIRIAVAASFPRGAPKSSPDDGATTEQLGNIMNSVDKGTIGRNNSHLASFSSRRGHCAEMLRVRAPCYFGRTPIKPRRRGTR